MAKVVSPWIRKWREHYRQAPKLTVVEMMSFAESSQSSSEGDSSSEEVDVTLHERVTGKGYPSETQESDKQDLESDILDSGLKLQADLKRNLETLAEKPYPDHYNEVADLRGAKPVYRPTICQLMGTQKTLSHTDCTLHGGLFEQDVDANLLKEVHTTMQVLCGEEPSSLWMFSSLPAHLNLPIDRCPPPSTVLQLFLLSPGLPPFVLTIFDAKKLKQEEIPNEHSGGELQESPSSTMELEDYTMKVCKLLMHNLLNYCSCDFTLLPCCLSVDDMTKWDSPDQLKQELLKQQKSARKFYGGRFTLSQSTFNQLRKAAVAVSSVSHVPLLMEKEPSNRNMECDLILMDDNWRETVSLIMEAPMSSQCPHIPYLPESEFKIKVAIVEAAKRLSFTDDVFLITPAADVINTCRKLNEKVLEETGVKLKLTAKSPSDRPEIEATKKRACVYLLDCPPVCTVV